MCISVSTIIIIHVSYEIILEMKQQQRVKCKENSEEKSESQMECEPTTLPDLVRCSNYLATGDSVVSKGQSVGLFCDSDFFSEFSLYLKSCSCEIIPIF